MASTTSCSSLFVAIMACMCFTAHAFFNLNIGMDICQKADYPALCRSVARGQADPSVVLEATIRLLMVQTYKAMGQARRDKTSAMEVCLEVYDDAFSSLQTAISNLKSHDKGSLGINLSAALTDYVTCDDAVEESGLSSPVTRRNARMRKMTSNCLYLSSLIRWH
ncbi:hypothetical protein SDJN02_07550, partial [Cucurbita argyrosperma subsp. argyrosperma]